MSEACDLIRDSHTAVIITPARWKLHSVEDFPAASSSIPRYSPFELVFGEIWQVICGGIPPLQITDMASSLRIKIIDVLCDYYRLLGVCR